MPDSNKLHHAILPMVSPSLRAPMSLLQLPPELQLMIARHLSSKDVGAFLRCSKKTYTSILEAHLYKQYNPLTWYSWSFDVPVWAAKNGLLGTLDKWLFHNPAAVTNPTLMRRLISHALHAADTKVAFRVLEISQDRVWVSKCLRESFKHLSAEGVALALHMGADLGAIDRSDLYRLFSTGSARVAQLLLSYGLDPNMRAGTHGTQAGPHDPGLPLLVLACQRNDTVILEALLAHGADIRSCLPPHTRSLSEQLSMKTEDTTNAASRPWLLRHAAMLAPNFSCLYFLLRTGHVRPSVHEMDGDVLEYLLHDSAADPLRAFLHRSPGEVKPRASRLACLATLLDHGLDPDALATPCRTWYARHRGRSSLLALAATEGHVDAVRLLLARGAAVDWDPLGDGTPLVHALRVARLPVHAAHRSNLLEAVWQLVEAGGSLSPPPHHGPRTAAAAAVVSRPLFAYRGKPIPRATRRVGMRPTLLRCKGIRLRSKLARTRGVVGHQQAPTAEYCKTRVRGVQGKPATSEKGIKVRGGEDAESCLLECNTHSASSRKRFRENDHQPDTSNKSNKMLESQKLELLQ